MSPLKFCVGILRVITLATVLYKNLSLLSGSILKAEVGVQAECLEN
jgi:hypothetical protein